MTVENGANAPHCATRQQQQQQQQQHQQQQQQQDGVHQGGVNAAVQ
jgi:hypothetical protein